LIRLKNDEDLRSDTPLISIPCHARAQFTTLFFSQEPLARRGIVDGIFKSGCGAESYAHWRGEFKPSSVNFSTEKLHHFQGVTHIE
jgi:hypothetical protein